MKLQCLRFARNESWLKSVAAGFYPLLILPKLTFGAVIIPVVKAAIRLLQLAFIVPATILMGFLGFVTLDAIIVERVSAEEDQ